MAVSRSGGTLPVWRKDGKELLFREPLSNAPVAADVSTTATTFTSGVPHRLFASNPLSWTVTNDGQRFLMSLPPQSTSSAPIVVVMNWASALSH
jgi:hypothetical protein